MMQQQEILDILFSRLYNSKYGYVEMSRKLGYSHGAMNNYQRQRRRVPLAFVIDMADALGVELILVEKE